MVRQGLTEVSELRPMDVHVHGRDMLFYCRNDPRDRVRSGYRHLGHPEKCRRYKFSIQ
jgi:hypothetical protein